ncbi:hypothetical protein JCM1840_002891 [Sporobolomyces johnsonii]
MAKHAGLVYYIDELAESFSEGLLLIRQFFLRNSSLHLEARPVSQNGTSFIYGSDSIVQAQTASQAWARRPQQDKLA